MCGCEHCDLRRPESNQGTLQSEQPLATRSGARTQAMPKSAQYLCTQLYGGTHVRTSAHPSQLRTPYPKTATARRQHSEARLGRQALQQAPLLPQVGRSCLRSKVPPIWPGPKHACHCPARALSCTYFWRRALTKPLNTFSLVNQLAATAACLGLGPGLTRQGDPSLARQISVVPHWIYQAPRRGSS